MTETETTKPEPEIIWSAELDKRYLVMVTRLRPYAGVLTIQDNQDSTNQIIHNEYVAIAFNAVGGPDMDDVEWWKTRAIAFVDSKGATEGAKGATEGATE